MGSVVKHVTGALTGHSGGGTTKSSEKSSTNNQQESWLERNPQYQQLQNNALAEANQFNTPEYQLAGSNNWLNSGMAGLAQGQDTSGYLNAFNQMQQQGQSEYNTGNNRLNQGYDQYSKLANMSQSDYQNMLNSEYNSDLVKSQIAGATQDIEDTYAHQVQGLNQSAVMHGGMGNSRAGVAQGVMAGKAQQAIANASVQYRSQEESAAANRLQSYLGMQQNVAGSMAGIGQNQMAQGLQQYGAGMGYYGQYNQANTQNLQNMVTAGQWQQQQAQQQIDVNRQNTILRQSPALARLAYYNQSLLSMANLQTFGTGTSEGSSKSTTPGQGGNMLGGLMGMGGSALGGYFGGPMGAQIGGSLGSSFGNSYGS